MQHSVFIGLGSNQGEKIKNAEGAIFEILKLKNTFLLARSSWYATEPWGRENQDWFINSVIKISTELSPDDLLKKCREIEKRLGREKREKWGPRIIDIDILFYDDLLFTSPVLQIPHPRIAERNFVLIPFAEIEPRFVHPVFKKTIKKILDTCVDRKKTVKAGDTIEFT